MTLNVSGSTYPKSMIFLTGFSGSGKSTIAAELATQLSDCVVLDGDEIRKAFGNSLPHGEKGLETNTDRLIELSLKHFKSSTYVVSAFVAPRAGLRERVKLAMTSQDIRFIEVHVWADLETCKQRDPKDLYLRYVRGEDVSLAGLNVAYDVPEFPDIICETAKFTVQENVSQILREISQKSFI